ncbi:hypothetical protein [Flavisolibacter ginsenosidimutans]|uniref:Uncharacterized protein n=1 Tax=Flavisolibacter ginsenosidimutans TaxID=661481 RepID=A0A5B8UNV2_9BACT|nr:hypothetical protein [Flavisolibacter ginsenosidimutans]QEC57625.1 hypothetical protein FSB75_17520 [Flavisolibacter ginsenosidimutans]
MDVVATLDLITASPSLTEQEERRKELAAYLNHLILNDFSALIQLLYRVDVSEQKLKTVLKENPQADAGELLAELLIQRQKEKTGTRKNSSLADEPSGEEDW